MFETIRKSPYNDGALLPWVKHSIAVALLAITVPSSPAVWGAQYEMDKLEKALASPPYVPEQPQNIANSFLEYTLPGLLASDERVAHQLGFGDSMSSQVAIDRALAVIVISRDDVVKLLKKEAKTFDPIKLLNLVNNTNNWLEDEAGRLVPKRIVFLLQAHGSASEAGNTWSSVTMEQPGDGSSWRIIQVGAPKLSQAMNQYGSSGENYFLLWIPDLNRHYLGSIKNHVITVKILFVDRLLHGVPGKEQAIDDDYLKKLKRLYEELDLPKKVHPETDKVGIRALAR